MSPDCIQSATERGAFNRFMAVNQVKAGVVLNYAVIGLNALVGLLYTPYMLRMMGQSEYGLYSLAASVIAYLTIMDFGFGNAIVRYTAKFRTEGKTEEQYSMFGMFAILYALIGLLTFVIGIVLCVNVEGIFDSAMTAEEISRARIILAILSFNLAISFPMGIFGSIVTAYERFVFQKTLNIARILLNTAVMICLLHFGYKAIAMVVVQTVFNVLTFVANWFYSRKVIKIKLTFGKFQWGFLKEVAIYSFWIFLNAIMDQLYWSTGQFVLGIFSGAIAVAVFSIAIHLKNMYYSFSIAISSVFLPKVTSMIARNESSESVSDLFVRVGRVQYIVISYFVTMFVLFGRKFIEVWAGAGYEGAYVVTLLFFISTAIPLIQNLGMIILQARNQLKYRSIMILVVSAVSVIVAIPMAKYYGINGLGWTIATAVVFGHGVLLNIYYHRYVGLNILKFWREILKMSFVPMVLIGIGLVGFDWLGISIDTISNLIISFISFSLVYVVAFYTLSMNDYERALIMTPIQNVWRRVRGR